jgi:predicted acetyltransferase
VLITCEVDNIASAKTIEHQGGVLEDVRDTELSAVRRYWIKI